MAPSQSAKKKRIPAALSDNAWWVITVGLLVVAVFAALQVAPDSNAGFPDAAAVIAFAAMIAVGIERSLEIMWTLVDHSPLGAYWPMSVIKKELNEAEDRTNAIIGDVLTETKAVLTTAKKAAGDAGEMADALDVQIARLNEAANAGKARFALAQKMAPGSARIANAAGAADSVTRELRSSLNLVGSAGTQAGKALDIAELRLTDALEVIASFQDNPFRRLSSLMLGAAVGALIAGWVGINLFAAISDAGVSQLQGAWGVVITGLVVGLGSGPTHELVKNLQANKKAGQLQPVQARGLHPVSGPGGASEESVQLYAEAMRAEGETESLNLIGRQIPVRALSTRRQMPPTAPRRTIYIRSTD